MNFGGLRALDKVDLDVCQGEIVALIGPTVRARPHFSTASPVCTTLPQGDVLISPPKNGTDPADQRPQAQLVTEKGLARTFQNIRLFQNMTVLENVMIGCHCRMKAGIWARCSEASPPAGKRRR
jgi:branched-chain amino acid transport system ATP-binding protein